MRIHIKVGWCFRIPVHTPVYYNVDDMLAAWKQLSPFRCRRGARVDLSLGMLSSSHEVWPRFREALISILARAGQSDEANTMRCDQVGRHLDALYESAGSYREQCMEFCNRRLMAQEERWQVRLATMVRRQAELQERRALRQEDHLSRRWRRSQAHDKMLLQRLLSLLYHWRRSLTDSEQRMRHRRHLAQCKAQRAAARQQKFERERRWRQMNRRDLTMEDLMGLHARGAPGCFAGAKRQVRT